MDVWNPVTFDSELSKTMSVHSEAIIDYLAEDVRLMDIYTNQKQYEPLGSNKFSASFYNVLENIVAPLLANRRIRVWHYTRLLDQEVESMIKKLKPSTLSGLQERLALLVDSRSLSEIEAKKIFDDSVFHKQENVRSGRLYTVSVPIPKTDAGVEPLLKFWGGEASYFWLTEPDIKAKLETIGKPRIIEIETDLHDGMNAYNTAETAIHAWAKSKGFEKRLTGSDLAIKDCLQSARVLRIHSEGELTFSSIGVSYPEGCSNLA